MPLCEDYPCCGHGPASTGGDGGGCPDEDGRYNCVLCGGKLELRASSSVCAPCLKRPTHDEFGPLYDDRKEDY